ncbi:MAG: hypothetical protein ACOH2I_07375 [Pseudomonas sp.]
MASTWKSAAPPDPDVLASVGIARLGLPTTVITRLHLSLPATVVTGRVRGGPVVIIARLILSVLIVIVSRFALSMLAAVAAGFCACRAATEQSPPQSPRRPARLALE